MNVISNEEATQEITAAIKNSQIFNEILLKLSSEQVLQEAEISSLKKDLLFTMLLVIMMQNGFQPLQTDSITFTPGTLKGLSKLKLSSGLYEAEFIMLGYNEITTKLLLIPLATTALINAVISENASETYSVCLPVDQYVVLTKQETGVSEFFRNVQQLTDIFKNQILCPVKSKLLSLCGYPSASLQGVPEDIALKIMLNLSIWDIISVTKTCKKLNQLLQVDHFWHKLYVRDYERYKLLSQSETLHCDKWKTLYINCHTTYIENVQKIRRNKEILKRERYHLLVPISDFNPIYHPHL